MAIKQQKVNYLHWLISTHGLRLLSCQSVLLGIGNLSHPTVCSNLQNSLRYILNKKQTLLSVWYLCVYSVSKVTCLFTIAHRCCKYLAQNLYAFTLSIQYQVIKPQVIVLRNFPAKKTCFTVSKAAGSLVKYLKYIQYANYK